MPRHLGFSDSVNLTISLCLTYTLCISCVRGWIRKGAFGVDDIVIAIATLVSFGHTAADYVALANGLGMPWAHIVNDENLSSLNAASIAGIVTYIVSLYLSKCAMISFLGRITKTHSQISLYHICNVLTAMIGVASILTVTLDCPFGSGYYWAFHSNALLACPSQSTRWQTLTAFDIISEILLLILPVHLVAGLQMPRSKKIVLLIAFYLRLPVIALSIGRNYYILQLRLPGVDPGLTSGLVVIWLEVQLAYALAAGTLSASKAFTESFNSGWGLGFARGKGEDSYGLSDLSGNTAVSSKDEKSRIDSALEGGTDTNWTRSLPPPVPSFISSVHSQDPMITPIPPPGSNGSLDLKLRPEVDVNSYTQITSNANTKAGPWTHHTTYSSEVTAHEMFILRETGYDVQHKEAPFIRMTSYYDSDSI